MTIHCHGVVTENNNPLKLPVNKMETARNPLSAEELNARLELDAQLKVINTTRGGKGTTHQQLVSFFSNKVKCTDCCLPAGL
ncbi:hypothetical protein CgunFtcFv8_001089 [Champsocephalus gunnari]|uniref:Uncharacterized protein n=1 Tax=Champsocephalus gunnari TaxID=52237 RepID=A0AAN8DJ68_CHAGU|nr:hypothetical protein CgunFtcFv8_001089 [Champsocephalus gunnari]